MTVVAVTGAVGFVGAHVVRLLLDKGYTVHAVVRDPHAEKTQCLRKMAEDLNRSKNPSPAIRQGKDSDATADDTTIQVQQQPEQKQQQEQAPLHTDPTTEETTSTVSTRVATASDKLILFAADLNKEGSFDEAFADATFVIHTAASVMLTARDPQREIIDRNVNGMLNVLNSCKKYAREGHLQRIIVTSSVSAVEDENRPEGHVYTEEDYNESASATRDPYQYSKYRSELTAQTFVDELSEEEKFSIAFINPGAIFGPLLAPHHVTSSPQIIHDLMVGKFPMVPQLSFPCIDVRDVALAHVKAMESDVTGRFICVEGTYSMQDMSRECKEAYPQYVFPTRKLPNFLMYVTAIFDKRITWHFCRHNLGKQPQFSNMRLQKDLDMSLTPSKDSFLATAASLLTLGLVPPKD